MGVLRTYLQMRSNSCTLAGVDVQFIRDPLLLRAATCRLGAHLSRWADKYQTINAAQI